MSVHAARGGAHEDLSWSALGRRAPRDVIVGDRGGGGGMRRAQQGGQGPAGAVRVDEASSASTFRELDDAFLQKQTKIWLGEVLHLRFDEDVLVADLLADGEILRIYFWCSRSPPFALPGIHGGFIGVLEQYMLGVYFFRVLALYGL